MTKRLYFASDYMEGAHPRLMQKLMQTNLEHTTGYGTDAYCDEARKCIRVACHCPDAAVHFLVGGTQTNATVIDAVLQLHQGVISADFGHVSVHEAGAIEFTGHKVLPLPSQLGKIQAADVRKFVEDFYRDPNHEHMVCPGMVYISQPTEYGTLYSKAEMQALSKVCREFQMSLYVDGARLAYALASPQNDVSLADLAELADVFYIGGTKCGAMLGEAVVFPNPEMCPHFFTIMKQHGALLAKGRILGVQYLELFRGDAESDCTLAADAAKDCDCTSASDIAKGGASSDLLYMEIGKSAVNFASEIKQALREDGYRLYFDSPTNQVFFILENDKLDAWAEHVEYSNFEKYDDDHTVVRFCTSWATSREDVAALVELIHEFAE